MLKWLRRKVTNNMAEDWQELMALSDFELLGEFERLLALQNGGDRLRRCCDVMALRWRVEQKSKTNAPSSPR